MAASAINVSGGSVNLLEAFNSSAINLSSGSVLRIDSYNNSTINISGGILSSGLYGYNDTTVSVSGGIIGSLTLTDNGVLNFFGTGFSSSYQGDHSGQFVYDVTGTLASGDKLNTVIFLDDTSQARFTFNAPAVVPESSISRDAEYVSRDKSDLFHRAKYVAFRAGDEFHQEKYVACNRSDVFPEARDEDGGAGDEDLPGIFQEMRPMPDDYLPKGKTQLQAWLTNFGTVAGAQAVPLGLLPADLSALGAAQGTFNGSVAGVKTAKAALKSATQTELTATKTVNTTVRGIVRRIQANPAVTPTQKASLGINPRSAAKNHAPPVTPTGLTAEGFSTGVNALKWDRAGNKSNTIFVIQAQIGASLDWVEVGSKNATKFDHVGQTPGVKVAYRVLATRAGMASVPSPSVTLYGASTGVVLTLAKAA
ncbi:uncharacterized protein KY384_000082 [Bacidia gigantensis]|uniref:uncharacterized protein n=1 Tax=Bacidia gigantensis TaxID=2732470 RepID=UPI001D054C77|nr:uncharacterized protein KY384_000082 [Bacidia gigantensis]KAG8526090.1 hypothetical protein KY384_000082 [Bacidia gigantensis]